MSTLAVVSQSGETLSFYDTDGKLTGQLKDLEAEPHELLYDERTNLMYLSHAYRHGWYADHGDYVRSVTVIDCAQRKVVDSIDVSPAGGTHYLALDKERDILYASVEDGISSGPNSGGIIGIDLKTRKVIKTIGSGYKTHWFVMTLDGKKAFTCNKDAGFISVIDLLEEKMIGKIDVPGGCEQPGLSNDGKLAYFPTPNLGKATTDLTFPRALKVIDTATAQIVSSISIKDAAASAHVDHKDRLVVGQMTIEMTKEGKVTTTSGGILVLSNASEGNRTLGQVETGEAPLTIFSSPDGRRAYVANIFKGNVSVIDMETFTIEQTLDVDLVHRTDKKYHNGSHGMALIP